MTTTDNRRIRRHCAYFRGWAQAFGTHDLETDDTHGFRWLLGDDQIGLILPPAVKGLLPADILELDERPRALAGTVPTACLLSSLQAGTLRLGGFPVAVGDTGPRIAHRAGAEQAAARPGGPPRLPDLSPDLPQRHAHPGAEPAPAAGADLPRDRAAAGEPVAAAAHCRGASDLRRRVLTLPL